MKFTQIHDSVQINFDSDDVRRIMNGEATVDQILIEAYLDIETKAVSIPSAGRWYYIKPTPEYADIISILKQGLYYVETVDAHTFTIRGEGIQRSVWAYKFESMPVANTIGGWTKTLLLARLKLTCQDCVGCQWDTLNGPACLSFKPRSNVLVMIMPDQHIGMMKSVPMYNFIRIYFTPTTVSNKSARHISLERVFNIHDVDLRFDAFIEFRDRCGYGYYRIVNGTYDDSMKSTVNSNTVNFYLPEVKDNEMFDPRNLEKYYYYTESGERNRQYEVYEHPTGIGKDVFYIYDRISYKYLWEDGTLNRSTGVCSFKYADLLMAPGYWKTRKQAEAFLTTWLDFDQRTIDAWDFVLYCVTTLADGKVDNFNIEATGIMDALRECIKMHPNLTLVSFSKINSKKFDKSKLL